MDQSAKLRLALGKLALGTNVTEPALYPPYQSRLGIDFSICYQRASAGRELPIGYSGMSE